MDQKKKKKDIIIKGVQKLGIRTPEKEGCLLLGRCTDNKINSLHEYHRGSQFNLKRGFVHFVIFIHIVLENKRGRSAGSVSISFKENFIINASPAS